MDVRYTPENISSLGKDEVFVFGSNLAGRHNGGAARVAYERFGAIMGQGVGMQGQSFAIPTMQGGVETIKPYVDDFIALAREWDQTTFYVTRIGCGIAGFKDEQIAPLFIDALDMYNVRLPKSFVDVLKSGKYAESYRPDWLEDYSSYDMAVDTLLILDRFRLYTPGDIDKALDDLDDLVGRQVRRGCRQMTDVLSRNIPGDSEPGTADSVERYIAAVESDIRHSNPFEIPGMRYICSVTAALAGFMLELTPWQQNKEFFNTLSGIVSGRWNCGDNSYIFDNIHHAYPVFRTALKENWQSLFSGDRIDRKKLISVFSNPLVWSEWNRRAAHGNVIYSCVVRLVSILGNGAECAYRFVGDGVYIPKTDYSLPVFMKDIGRVRFPNFAMKKAFIEQWKRGSRQ